MFSRRKSRNYSGTNYTGVSATPSHLNQANPNAVAAAHSIGMALKQSPSFSSNPQQGEHLNSFTQRTSSISSNAPQRASSLVYGGSIKYSRSSSILNQKTAVPKQPAQRVNSISGTPKKSILKSPEQYNGSIHSNSLTNSNYSHHFDDSFDNSSLNEILEEPSLPHQSVSSPGRPTYVRKQRTPKQTFNDASSDISLGDFKGFSSSNRQNLLKQKSTPNLTPAPPKMVKKYIPTPNGIKVIEVPAEEHNAQVMRSNSFLRKPSNIPRTSSVTSNTNPQRRFNSLQASQSNRNLHSIQSSQSIRNLNAIKNVQSPQQRTNSIKAPVVSNGQSKEQLELKRITDENSKLLKQLEKEKEEVRRLETERLKFEAERREQEQAAQLREQAAQLKEQEKLNQLKELEKEKLAQIKKDQEKQEAEVFLASQEPPKTDGVSEGSVSETTTTTISTVGEEEGHSIAKDLTSPVAIAEVPVIQQPVVFDEPKNIAHDADESDYDDDDDSKKVVGFIDQTELIDDIKQQQLHPELDVVNAYENSLTPEISVEKAESSKESEGLQLTPSPEYSTLPTTADYDHSDNENSMAKSLRPSFTSPAGISNSIDEFKSPKESLLVPDRLDGYHSSNSSISDKPIKSAMKMSPSRSFENPIPKPAMKKSVVTQNPAELAYLSLTTAENTRLNAQISQNQQQFYQPPPQFQPPQRVKSLRPQSLQSEKPSMGQRSFRSSMQVQPIQPHPMSQANYQSPSKLKAAEVYAKAERRPHTGLPTLNRKSSFEKSEPRTEAPLVAKRMSMRDPHPPQAPVPQMPDRRNGGGLASNGLPPSFQVSNNAPVYSNGGGFQSRFADSDDEDSHPIMQQFQQVQQVSSSRPRNNGFRMTLHDEPKPEKVEKEKKKSFSKLRKLFGRS